MLETYDLLIMEFVFKNKFVTFEELAKVFPEENTVQLIELNFYVRKLIQHPPLKWLSLTPAIWIMPLMGN